MASSTSTPILSHSDRNKVEEVIRKSEERKHLIGNSSLNNSSSIGGSTLGSASFGSSALGSSTLQDTNPTLASNTGFLGSGNEFSGSGSSSGSSSTYPSNYPVISPEAKYHADSTQESLAKANVGAHSAMDTVKEAAVAVVEKVKEVGQSAGEQISIAAHAAGEQISHATQATKEWFQSKPAETNPQTEMYRTDPLSTSSTSFASTSTYPSSSQTVVGSGDTQLNSQPSTAAVLVEKVKEVGQSAGEQISLAAHAASEQISHAAQATKEWFQAKTAETDAQPELYKNDQLNASTANNFSSTANTYPSSSLSSTSTSTSTSTSQPFVSSGDFSSSSGYPPTSSQVHSRMVNPPPASSGPFPLNNQTISVPVDGNPNVTTQISPPL